MKIQLFLCCMLISLALQAQLVTFRCVKIQFFTHPIMTTKEANEKGVLEYLNGGCCNAYYIVDLDKPSLIYIDSAIAEKVDYYGVELNKITNVSLNNDSMIDVWFTAISKKGDSTFLSLYYEKKNNVLLVRYIKDDKVCGFFSPDVEVTIRKKEEVAPVKKKFVICKK